MFNRPSINDYYYNIEGQIRNRISKESKQNLLNENYAKILFEEYSLPEIIIDNNKEILPEKIEVGETNIYGKKVNSLWVRIRKQVNPNQDIQKVLDLMPSEINLAPPKILYTHGQIYYECKAEKTELDSTSANVLKEIDRRNKDVREGNNLIRKIIKESIENRQKIIEHDDDVIKGLTEK